MCYHITSTVSKTTNSIIIYNIVKIYRLISNYDIMIKSCG